MLFVVEERLEGFKYNIGLEGGGGSTKICPLPKKGAFSTLFPSLQFKLIRIREVFRRIEND